MVPGLMFCSMSRIAISQTVRSSNLDNCATNINANVVSHSILRSNLQVASFQFMQTIFDTFTLGLMLWKSIKSSSGQGLTSLGGLQALIIKQGLIYYMYVFLTVLNSVLIY